MSLPPPPHFFPLLVAMFLCNFFVSAVFGVQLGNAETPLAKTGQGNPTTLDSTYKGDMRDGQPHGVGVMVFADGSRYEGEFKDGKITGRGVYVFFNGVRYEGELLDSKYNGYGVFSDTSGNSYEGEFKAGKFHGKGIRIYVGDSRCEGSFKHGKLNGQGFCTYTDGRRYEGVFKDDVAYGHGVHTDPGGTRYEGEFKEGKYHGQGSHTYADGASYKGEYKENNFNGQGVYIFADGEKYVGEFKDGMFNGLGVRTYPNGSRYEGEFKADKFHGQGVRFYSVGSRYEGEFKDGLADGLGVYIFPDGSRYEGNFKDDKFQGQGVGTYINGDRFENSFFHAVREDVVKEPSVHILSSGARFEGQLKYGKMVGRGVITYPDGSRYEGEFKEGALHGQGVFIAADGKRYDGAFANNRFMSGGEAEGIPVVAKGNMEDPRRGWSPEPQPWDRAYNNFYEKIAGYDLAEMFMGGEKKYTYLGFIGKDRQRFFIHFTNVVKIPNNPYQYSITGKTRVKNNICTFSGTITITLAAIEVKDPEHSTFLEYQEGVVQAQLDLRENKKELGSGVFRGHMWTNFAINANDILRYNDLNLMADNFENNQFTGTWKSYKTGVSKICNFGNFRVPRDGLSDNVPFDRGADVFVPAKSLLNRGWQGYYDCEVKKIDAACQEEKRQWWN